MGFHHANFGLPRPFRSRLRSRHGTDGRADRETDRQTDRQTDTGAHFIMYLPYGGGAYSLIKPKDAHKSCKFCRNRARDPPRRSYYSGKFQRFEGSGAAYPHPWTAQGGIRLDRRSVSSLYGRKPKIRPWVKTKPVELPFGNFTRWYQFRVKRANN